MEPWPYAHCPRGIGIQCTVVVKVEGRVVNDAAAKRLCNIGVHDAMAAHVNVSRCTFSIEVQRTVAEKLELVMAYVAFAMATLLP